MSNNSYLVTGGTGFSGSALVRLAQPRVTASMCLTITAAAMATHKRPGTGYVPLPGPLVVSHKREWAHAV
jgi:hypothetical protein